MEPNHACRHAPSTDCDRRCGRSIGRGSPSCRNHQSWATGISTFPEKFDSVRAYQILDEEFNAGRLAPTEIVVSADDVRSQEIGEGFERLRGALADDTRFQWGNEPMMVSEDRNVGMVRVFIRGDAFAGDAREAIDDLRDQYISAAFQGVETDVLVTGGSAQTVDYIDAMVAYLPIVVGFVLSLSFVLLMLVFRSIVIPVKAILMNLLSVAASYGLIVLVFQHGVGVDILGFRQTGDIAAFLPVFLFAILFGYPWTTTCFCLPGFTSGSSRLAITLAQSHTDCARRRA
ncbi:MAG: MMPL family transporter [Dehalococcoidia bacterium]|nr:MMPL family transporter [Dehalococcoidia bacterium]